MKGSARALISAAENPLWPDGMPEVVHVARMFRDDNFHLKRGGFQPWLFRLDAVTLARGGEPSGEVFDEELALKIALQPDEWWKRPAREINADVASWLDERAAATTKKASRSRAAVDRTRRDTPRSLGRGMPRRPLRWKKQSVFPMGNA